jgi:hypothetical protein
MLYVNMNMNSRASIPDTLSPEWMSTEFDATIQNVWMLDGHHIDVSGPTPLRLVYQAYRSVANFLRPLDEAQLCFFVDRTKRRVERSS